MSPTPSSEAEPDATSEAEPGDATSEAGGDAVTSETEAEDGPRGADSDHGSGGGRPALRAAAIGLLAGFAGGAAATTLGSGAVVRSVVVAVLVAGAVTYIASRPSLPRLRPD